MKKGHRALLPAALMFLAVLPVFGLEELILKDTAVIVHDRASVQDIVLNPVRKPVPINIRKSGYYSNLEISAMLSKSGIGDFTLIGKGVQVYCLEKELTMAQIESILKQRYPGLAWVPADDGLFRTGIVENYNAALNGNRLDLNVRFLVSSGTDFIFSNRLYSMDCACVDGDRKDDALTNGNIPGDGMYICNILASFADIVYKKNGLLITSRVRIMRKLDEGLYLIENPASGRVFRAYCREE